MAAFAVFLKGPARNVGLSFCKRNNINCSLLKKSIEIPHTFIPASGLYNHTGLEKTHSRHSRTNVQIDSRRHNLRVFFAKQNSNKSRCIYNHQDGMPFSS